jgi:hypothetical protein
VTPDLDPVAWARRLHEWGSDDAALDVLMALGPVVVFALAVGGRTLFTTALATVYVAGFVGALVRNVAAGSDD